MKKKLRKTGASYSLLMPRTILELMNIDPEIDLVEIRLEGDVLKVKKAVPLEFNKEIHP